MVRLYDVIVIGGGPAGLTAALYLARAGYQVLVLEREQFGGQIAITHQVVNYPGIADISGRVLAETMQQQAKSFGAEFLQAEATGLALQNDVKTVFTTQGEFQCLGLLLATGAQPKAAGFQGELEYRGRGVGYCATCDGEFFTDREVYVVGGGYAAAEESLFLTRYASHVTILIRRNDFSCAASLARQARTHPKITVLTNTVLEEVSGEAGLQYARYRNTATGQVTEIRKPAAESFGVFVFTGRIPATQLLLGMAELNADGYVRTDHNQQTSLDGVYAAGDVCIKPLRQVVTATGDGAIAATALEKYVAARQEQTGLRPQAPARNDHTSPNASSDFLSADMKQQLTQIFSRMENALLLKLYLDQRPASAELQNLLQELSDHTDKLTVVISESPEDSPHVPWVQVCHADGTPTGLGFHGVPGGHEFTSFLLGLYHASGVGQTFSAEEQMQIATIDHPVNLKILVTLSCSLCPDLVEAAQKIALANPHITAHVYDLRLFPDLQQTYQVMSVPCLVVNDNKIFFGRKTTRQLIDLLQ